MTEQMPGEVIYEYTIQSTGATSYGALALDALLSGVADIRPQGAPIRPRGLVRLLRSRAVGDLLSDAGKPLGWSRLASAQG
jgi:hypothetical protein